MSGKFKSGEHYSRLNEMQVLGVLSMFPEAAKFVDSIKMEWFYDDVNRAIFEVIADLKAKGTFNINSIITELDRVRGGLFQNQSTAWAVTRCTDKITGVHGFKYGLAMLEGMYNYRQAEIKVNSESQLGKNQNQPDNDFE